MAIKVEVDQVILSGEPFDVTLSVGDGEGVGTFDMTLEINGEVRPFALQLGTRPESPCAGSQVVEVREENIWTVLDWGTAAPGSPLIVKLTEQAGVEARSGSDHAAVMPASQTFYA